MMAKDDEYKVGYRRPPKHSQFKKGRSGNPGGRRKQPLSMPEAICKQLGERVTIREGGVAKRMPKSEVIARQVVNKAMTGDPKAINLVQTEMRRLQSTPANLPPEIEVTLVLEDEETLRAMEERRRAALERKEDPE